MTTEPLWRQVYGDLRERIKAGEIEPGDRLPSEPALMAAHRVGSRATIRRAVRELASEGLIGADRRVADLKPVALSVSDEETLAFIRDLAAAGHVTMPPRITVDHRGDNLVRTVLREVDGEPHNIAEWTFPLEMAQGTRLDYDTDIPEGSVKYLKEGLGWEGLEQEKWIEARMPGPEEASVLRMSGGPVLVEHRVGRQDGEVIFRSVRVLRADRTRLVP